MSNTVTEHLEPQAFFYWFEKISQIPHGSGKEQQLAAFLADYAKARSFPCRQDAIGNLLMCVPATAGYEEVPTVLFQAHMDMVWAKAPGVEFDFETQPLRLAIDGDRLHAQGTTLGADNAVGMATMLALGDAKDIPHPALEFLFTVQEEVGMLGILAFEMQKLKARRMVNMDCGDSHVLGVSGAGRVFAQIDKTYPLHAVPRDNTCLRIELGGGLGGHSGLEIHKGRCCAGNAMGELLTVLEPFGAMLCSLEARGPILKSAAAVVAVPEARAEAAKAALQAHFALLRQAHAQADPGLWLKLTAAEAETAVAPQATQDIGQVLSLLRTMRYRAEAEDPTVTVTSGGIDRVCLAEGVLELVYGFRSSSDADQALLVHRHTQMAKAFGMELRQTSGYPGWPEKKTSPFREKFLRHHEAIFGRGMELERVPGGIECGVVVAAIPDMDAVGLAPTSRGAHAPHEYLSISEVEPYWTLLKAVLADKT